MKNSAYMLLVKFGFVSLLMCEVNYSVTAQTTTKAQTDIHIDKYPYASYDVDSFISKNLVYPEATRKKRIEGKVVLSLLVNQEGELTSIKAISSPDTALSRAAVDVVRKLPKWNPGEVRGKKAAISSFLTVVFKLKIP